MPDLPDRAEAFARRVHAGHTRKGAPREPYDEHLADVAGFVARHGGDPLAVAAAWLHDTVEDTAATPAEIAAGFGPEVAALVAELTDDRALPRSERKRLQVAGAPGRSPRAALIKIADKWSNVRSVAASPPEDWPRERCLAYLDWAAEVVSALPPGHEAARADFARALAAARTALAAGAATPEGT